MFDQLVVSTEVLDEKRFDIITEDGEVLWNGRAQYEATGDLVNKYPTSKQVVQLVYEYIQKKNGQTMKDST